MTSMMFGSGVGELTARELIGGAACVAAAVLLVSQSLGAPPMAPGSAATGGGLSHVGALPRGLVAPGERCPGAKIVDVTNLQLGGGEELAITPVLPSESLARPTQAWSCHATPVVMFGGIQVTYSVEDPTGDPEAFFAALAESSGGRAEQFNGRPGLVHVPRRAGDGSYLVASFFAGESTMIELIATRGESEAALLGIANSIAKRL